jgi:TM2 domain-containing membrane protein YozV
MSKIMRIVLVVFIALALLVAWKFGRPGAEQMLYLGKMVAGWLLWTVAVSVVYWALEALFPQVLCASRTENSFARTDGH